MGGFSSKKKDVRGEVWREESVVENKLGQKADTWGGITSYNLLDIQNLSSEREPLSAPNHQPLHQKFSNEPTYDFESVDEDSACPKNYRPNPAKPPIEKTYYKSPKRVKDTKVTSVKNRPLWKNDIETPTPRKQSLNSDISTLSLHETDNNQPFKTVTNPAESMKKYNPSKKTSKVKKSRSLPSLSPKTSPSTSLSRSTVNYNHLDKYKPPTQYLTTRERLDLLREKQEKEKNNNLKSLSIHEKKAPVSKSKGHNDHGNVSRKIDKPIKRYYESEQAQVDPEPTYSVPNKKPITKQSERTLANEKPKKKPIRPDPSKIYSVPNKKVRNVSDSSSQSLKASDASSGLSSRKSSISNNFTDMKGIKSASVSIVSNTSNLGTRSKVIQFNDKKQSLGSVGMITITKLENSFKVRQFPDGAKQGFSKAVSLMESVEWEQNIEGLELLVSLANQHSNVLEDDIKTTRTVLLKSIKNLRSQVSRAACQAAAVIFLTLGKSMETDLEKIVKELLQKSAETNKFIRSDSLRALEVMAENLSVYKIISTIMTFFSNNKNVVIRANVTKIVDSVIVRLGAERFMGSSVELHELLMVDGSKMLTDANVDVRQHGKHLWGELVQHAKTEQMLKQYVKDPELRNVQKILDSLR